jgi:outer membrane protein TolC
MPVRLRDGARSSACAALLLPAVLHLAACESVRPAPRYENLAGELERSRPAAWEDPAPHSAPAAFAGAITLEREALVAEVLRRNPGLAAAHEAWRGALARLPQAAALDDPTLGYAVGPASLGSRAVHEAHRVELRQAFPFPGKRALRGELALAEAEGAAHDFAAARLRLATLASLLYDDYYLAARALEVNAHHREILRGLHAVATARSEAGLLSAQAPLRSELERAELERDQVTLETEAVLLKAQLNALLHRLPDLPLPPPPVTLEVEPSEASDGARAVATALACRPELRAAEARVRGGEAAVALARREFLPDFALSAGYDGFWEVSELRPMLGVEVTVPLQLGRRRAALEEAQAGLERARREKAALESDLRLAVETSVQRTREAGRLLTLYRDRLAPAARDQLEAARAAFEAGQETFLAVLSAEKDLREVELGGERALATLHRRQLELRSATGALLQP